MEIKNKYTTDDKYLAVITNNGLWIKDTNENKINIIHASKIDDKFLINTFISQFDKNYNITKHIQSNKIDISQNNWIIYDPKIYENDTSYKKDFLNIFQILIMKKYKVYFLTVIIIFI